MSAKQTQNEYVLTDLDLNVSGRAVVRNVTTRVFEKSESGERRLVAEKTQNVTFDFSNVGDADMTDLARVLLQELIVKFQNNRARRNPEKWLADDTVDIDVKDLLTKQTVVADPAKIIGRMSDDEFEKMVLAEMQKRGLKIGK